MRRQNRAKNSAVRLKRKLVKKVNFLNISIAVVCVLAGYMVVVFFAAVQNDHAEHNSIEEITRSADRIADSFELYNQKRFLNAVALNREVLYP